MSEGSTWVGMDVHQEQIVVAMLCGWDKEPREIRVPHTARGVGKLVRTLNQHGDGRLECAYEAGPCGFDLQRRFRAEGIRCAVIAPSLMLVKPGERIKTDRRDARKLAEQLRARQLTEVHAPSQAQEAVRDLCRCREDAREDLMRARHRLSKMLVRRGLVYRAGNNWTHQHRRWLLSLEWEHEADRTVFGDYLHAAEQLQERVKGLVLLCQLP